VSCESRLVWVACAFLVANGCGLDSRELRLGADKSGTNGGGGTNGEAGFGPEIPCVTGSCSTGGDDAGGGADSAGGDASGGSGANDAAGGDDAIGGRDDGPPPVLIGKCPDRNSNSVADCEETLAVNGAYHQDVASWLQEPGVSVLWQGLDSLGVVDSGAASVTYEAHHDVEGTGVAGTMQCIVLSGVQKIDIWADIMIKGGQSSGQGLINVLFFPSADCSGAIMPGAFGTTSLSMPGQWATVSGSGPVPVGALSMKVRLAVSKPFRNPKLEVLFDNVLIQKH
jgi:hypothetical protein